MDLGLKKNFAWMSASRMVAMASAIVISALVNRALGPSGRGIFAEIQTWIALFMTLLGLSLESAIYHFSDRKKYDIDDSTRFVTVGLLSLSFAITGAVVFFLSTRIFPDRFSSTAINSILIISLLLISSMVANHINIFIQANGNMKHVAITGIFVTTFSAAITIAAYFAHCINVTVMLILTFIPQPVLILGLIYPLIRQNGFSGRFSVQLAKGLAVSGLKQHLGTVCYFVSIRINQLILFKYCGEAAAGNYAVSLSAILSLMVIPATFQQALYPRVIHSGDDVEVTIKSARYALYIWGLISLGLFILARPLLMLYAGKAFSESPEIFRILLVMCWLNPVSSMLAPYMTKKGAFWFISLTNLFVGAFSLAMNFLLIPHWGIKGAAATTSFACVLGPAIFYLGFCRLSKQNPVGVFIPDFSDLYKLIARQISKFIRARSH